MRSFCILLGLLIGLVFVATPRVQNFLAAKPVAPVAPVIAPITPVAKPPVPVAKPPVPVAKPPVPVAKPPVPVAKPPVPVAKPPVPVAKPPVPVAKPGLTITEGPVFYPLPKFVQTLSDDDFAVWATWQNLQASNNKSNSFEPMHLRGQRTSTSIYVDRVGNRRGSNTINGLTISEAMPTMYVNPDYTGPGPLTVYNPFCRSVEGDGTPNWSELYVPFDGGVCNMVQAMRVTGRRDAERLYSELMR